MFSVSTGSARQIQPQRSRGMECSQALGFGHGLRLRYLDRPEAEKGNRLDSQRPRVMLLRGDRDKITAGYSPFVLCSRGSWSQADGYKGGPIIWDLTVESAIAYGDTSETPPIRIPGLFSKAIE